MRRHRHDFVETYDGILAFGYSREEDERSLIAFLQKFSDDDLMKLLGSRISPSEIENLVDLLTGLMKKHLSEEEYHRYFLKDEKA
jgi:acyl-coenzyme A synthetase/AMP-(fatty) acid ligase